MKRQLYIFVFLLFSLISLAQKFGGGISYGFGYSSLQYSVASNNPVFTYPSKFTARIPDQNGNVLEGQMVFENKKYLWGFTAQFEWMVFKLPMRRIYHGPHIFVSYQKSNFIEANMWAPGYFFRFMQPNSHTGFQISAHIFPNNKFMVELDSLSNPTQSGYMFNGKDFGDTVKATFTETKTSLCIELAATLSLSNKFDIRLSGGFFFALKTKERTRIVSEDGNQDHYLQGHIYAPGGKAAQFPLITPGYIYLRAGLYLTDFVDAN
jgi:hypothetical protein